MALARESTTTSSPAEGLLVVPLVTVPVICAAKRDAEKQVQIARQIVFVNLKLRIELMGKVWEW